MGLLLGTAVIAGYYTLPAERGSAPHAPVLTVLWLNVLIMIGALVVEIRRRPFSLHLLHLLCLFLFFGVAGLCQYAVGRYGVAGPTALMAPYNFTAAAVTSAWLISYLLVYELHHYASPRPSRGAISRFLSRPLTAPRVFVNLCFAFATIAYLAAIGLAGVLTRAGAEEAVADYSMRAGASQYTSPFYLIHFYLLRAYPLVAFVAGLLVFTRGRGIKRNFLLLMAVVAVGLAILVANNPFATYRMWFVTALFGFLGPYLFLRFRTGSAVVLATLAGLAILPSLGAARHAETFHELVSEYLRLDSPFIYLSQSSDVDAMGMLTLCLKWMASHGHRWGLQMLGVMLCWIPRTLWPGKPIGTGAMVTGDLGFEFTNLSSPIVAEPLVDFGFLGVLIFAALFALVLSRLDRLYHSTVAAPRESHPRVIDAIYPFWLGCVVFLTRGDLLAAVTHTSAFTFWILALGLGIRGTDRIRPEALPAHGSL